MLMGESQGRELNILDMNVTDEAYESISQFGNQFPHDEGRDLNNPKLLFEVSKAHGKNLEQEGIKIRSFQNIERERNPGTAEENKAIISREMSRLQLEVEMRTGDERNLRGQLAMATEELKQAEIAKEKLKKIWGKTMMEESP
jgi:hypothetical protein